MRLGRLDGPEQDPNLLFRTSVAVVDVDVRKTPGHPRIQGDELPSVVISQQHITWNAGARKIETFNFWHANDEAKGARFLAGTSGESEGELDLEREPGRSLEWAS